MDDEPATSPKWQERAVNRSLRAARERAISRGDQFIAAAADLLRTTGKADFTVQEVVDRSGLSLRSFYQHFATKDDLLAAVVEALFDQLRTEYELRFDAIAPAERTMRSALALLGEQMSDERLHAAFDLYTDARTDPTLQASLQPVVTSHVDNIFELGRALLDEIGGTADDATRAIIELAILSMQGLMLNNMAAPDPHARQRLESLLESLVPTLFGIG